MGLIDFVKDAGAELLKRVGAVDEVDRDAVLKTIADHGFQVTGLDLQVAGDVATVSGTTRNQSDREKIVLVVGNTKGVARVDDRLQVEAPKVAEPAEPEGTYYEVKKGDSLSKIAKAHYGDAMKYPMIFEANRPMLKDPDKIYPGQILRLPPAS